jgi:multidrug resistance protein
MTDTSAIPATRQGAILGVIFLTVFLDLVGFGMVIPILPIYAHDQHASGWQIGAIMAVYSLMQFVFSPLWGRWSDRIGRRRPMLIGTLGATGSYVVFALGAGLNGHVALAVFFASRMLAGFFGANLPVAQAAIADITPPEQRSRRMGLIGMAFGLGFVLGPWLGGVSLKHFGVAGPGWVAAGFCAANFLCTLLFLPETRREDSEHVARCVGTQRPDRHDGRGMCHRRCRASHPLRAQQFRLHEHGLHGVLLEVRRVNPCIRSQAMPCFSSITAMACEVSKVGSPWPPHSVYVTSAFLS